MKFLGKTALGLVFIVAGSSYAMDYEDAMDYEKLAKKIQLSGQDHRQLNVVDPRTIVVPTTLEEWQQEASRALIMPSRVPQTIEQTQFIQPVQFVQQQPVLPVQMYTEPSQIAKMFDVIKNEGCEVGKSLLCHGTTNLCDLSLRYAQRNTLPEALKSWWLIRGGCYLTRLWLTGVAMESYYPKHLITKPTTAFEYIRRVALIEYLLERSMYKEQPSKKWAVLKAFACMPN